MKQYVILIVGFFMLVRPLWPVVEYVANYDYIKNVLCENRDRPQLNCDGKCYLAKQFAKEAERSEKNPFGEKQSKTEIQPIVFFQELAVMHFSVMSHLGKKKRFYPLSALTALLLTTDIAHPPQYS
tara:strand:+ start:14044 stop:14421 length:378 start_codon:yes stop_codon:yes gene_type:complete